MGGLIRVLLSCVGVLFIIQKALGLDHTVQGWQLSTVNASGYTRSSMVFSVGDALVFKRDGGEGDIAEVSKSDYELCSAEASKAIYREGRTAAIYFNRTGNWYFISKAPGRCKSGKKLMITVVATQNNTRKKTKNRAGFRFRETSNRMGFGGRGRGGGRGGGIGGGSPGFSIPKGYKTRLPTRGRSHGWSAPQLSAMDLKPVVMIVFFCSVLLVGPFFV